MATAGSNQYFGGAPAMPAGNVSMFNNNNSNGSAPTWPGSMSYFNGPSGSSGASSPGTFNGWKQAPTAQGGAAPNAGNPYQVPATGPQQYPWGADDYNYQGAPQQGRTTNPGSENLGHGIIATGLQYGGLSQDFADYLMSQIGAGTQPFNLQTMLPTGGITQPGQLTAGMNPLLSQLMNFYQGGKSSSPGANMLSQVANNGISALPEWQSMLQAQQQNIGENEANLKEQFASMGDLAGSPFGTAMSDYMSQTTANQNAQLGQLQQTNILQGQLPTAQSLLGGSNTMATGLQNLDQTAINNMMQQFQTSLPQNNPMLQYIGALSTLYPSTNKTPTSTDQFTNILGTVL